MAYSDADLLNLYTGFTYGISSAEVKIQALTGSDLTNFVNTVVHDWNTTPSPSDAQAILKLSAMGIPLPSSLISSVKAYNTAQSNNEQNAKIVPEDVSLVDSSQLSLTSSNSKYSTAVANGGLPSTDTTTTTSSVISSANLLNRSTASSASDLTASPTSSSSDIVVVAQPVNDRRVRLSPRAAVFDQLITADGIMAPLRPTYGLMFPITPSIAENVDVSYQSYEMAHSLMPIQAFKSGGQKTLTLEATFVAQTDTEARYCLACIHFLRSFSKMSFGDTDPNAGTPPPILVFNAYGNAAFHNLPVIITTGSINWPNDVDYVYTTASSSAQTSVRTASTMVADGWVPSKFTISLTLVVQPSPAKLRTFNLEQFRNGDLLSKGGWI